MRELLLVTLAGAAGTLGRWSVGKLSLHVFGEGFPYGTLAVNVLGCLLLGCIGEIATTSETIPKMWRIPIMVGGLGAFTTFSTVCFDTLRYLEQNAVLTALGNIAANLVPGLLAVWLGFTIARHLFG